MRIVGYARVSSREQAENSQALEQQISRLKAAGAEEIFVDVQSRSRDNRKQLLKILDLVDGQLHTIYVSRVDRFTDSHALLEKAILLFLETEVRLVGLDDNIDLHTVGGRMHARLLVTFARAEIERLSERVKFGYQHLKSKQVAINPPFGYRTVDGLHKLDHRPYRDSGKSKAEVARELVEAFLKIGTLRGTLQVMNHQYGPIVPKGRVGAHPEDFPHTPSGVARWLTSPVLQGHLVYYKRPKQSKDLIVTYNTHSDQCLVSQEEAQAIKALLKTSREVRGWGATAPKHLFTGLIYCGACGKRCYTTTGRPHQDGQRVRYYRCITRNLGACDQKYAVRADQLEARIIQALLTKAQEITALADQPPEYKEPIELKELRAQLQGLEMIPGYSNAIETAKQDLRNQIQNFQHELGQEQQAQSGNRELLLEVTQDPSFWRTLPPDEKQEIYRKLVDRVVIQNGKVESVMLKV